MSKTAIVPSLRRLRAGHQARHTPSGFEFAFFDKIRFVPTDDWDFVTIGQSVFFDRRLLEALDRFPPSNVKPSYALIYYNEEPAAALVVQTVSLNAADLMPVRTGKLSPLSKGVSEAAKRFPKNILICGNLVSWGPHGVAVRSGFSEKPLWAAVAEALYRMRRANKLFGETSLIMLKDVNLNPKFGGALLKKFSYRPLTTEPNMVLKIDPSWKSFPDYLAALKKDYRRTANKAMESVSAQGLLLERLDATRMKLAQGELHSLYKSVVQNQKLRLASLHPEYLPALAQGLGKDFHTNVLLNQSDGTIRGFVTVMRDGDGAVAYYIGFERREAKENGSYFRLLQSAVASGIEMNARWISFGRTALEAKARLGAKPEKLQCYVRHRVPALNLLVRSLLHVLPDPDDAPERNPFKS